jgi:hypothetical protein
MTTEASAKPDPVDAAAEEAVRILNVAPLFENKSTADKIFAQIARCDAFVEREKPADADTTFTEMALELSRELIHFATNVHSLNHARNWVAANGLVDGRDAMSVLSVLTLIHTVNKAVKRYPKESNWTRMKKRVDRLRFPKKAA